MNRVNKIFMIALCYFIFIVAISAQSSAPRVSVQGTLKDNNGALLADGEYAVTFKLYNHPTTGNPLWTEEATISLAGGIYNHFLGSVNPLNGSNFSSTLYFTVKVGAYELRPRTELTYAPYAFAVREVACSGAVGDIKYSVLKPSQFALVNGACWVPMDGRTMAGSKLKNLIIVDTVPNGGGLFIRAQEYAGGANNDPGRTSSSPIATIQNQDFVAHNHPVSDPGHSHSFADARHNENHVDLYQTASTSGSYLVSSFTTNELSRSTNNDNPSISVQNNSGTETRPKNLNFWVYIRIN